MNWENTTSPLHRSAHHLKTHHNDPRILVAIEYPVEALALESLLRGESYQNVRVTTDIREIAPMFARWPFQLLILDMHSKLMDPATVMLNLARPISEAELSVLALINPDADKERLAAKAAGAVETMSRPLSYENALPLIKSALATGPIKVSSF
ncbi:hypothetical protein [Magnetovibrio sp.]|uniref:hypothetical protein n=1 Tax=Magnetovibrio sp. TaxID=2024836 RepID=UPI002F94A1ED